MISYWKTGLLWHCYSCGGFNTPALTSEYVD